jgi:O-antigen/teichoic acid export membrane protein
VPLTTLTVGLRGELEAYEDFRDVNLLRMLLGVANFALPTLSVMWLGPSLAWMVASLMAARLVVAVAHWVLVRRRLGAGFAHVAFAGDRLRGVLSFGAWLTVSNVVSPLMVSADRFVISAVLGAAVVAFYTVPSEVIARALILPGALTNALFPRMASLLTRERAAAQLLYRRCLALVAGVLLGVCPLLMAGASWGLTLWLGAEFAERSSAVLRILALGLLLNGIASVPYAVVQAAGYARVTAQFHLAEVVVYFPVLWVGLLEFGLAGAAFAWTLRVGVDMLLLLLAAQRLVFSQASVAQVDPVG